ncbi:MAG: DUF4347 domain-containing protein [Azospirillum sp.]|nr:DUF4347 domain-containing protein [Azospirillum sp.]
MALLSKLLMSRRTAPWKPAAPPLALALEPRYLFDGAAVASAADAASSPDHPADQAGNAADPVAQALADHTPPASDPAPPETSTAPAPAAASGPQVSAAQGLRACDPSQDGGRREVVFIESNVADYQTLVDGMKPGIEVELLDATQDGLSQIAKWAQSHSGYDAIHIISHGNQGTIELGIFSLDSTGTQTRAADLATLGAALTADGDLLLYGCEVAGGTGQTLITALAAATGADVAASSDETGALSADGNWVLERSFGTIETALPLEAAVSDRYDHLLSAPKLDSTITFGTMSGVIAAAATNNSASDLYADGAGATTRAGLNISTSTTGSVILQYNALAVTTASGISDTGDAALTVFNSGSTDQISSVTISSNDASGFKLKSFVFAIDLNSTTTATDNVTISGVTASGNTVSVSAASYTEQTSISINLSSNTDFQNIKSFTLSFANKINRFQIDDVLLTAAVASDTTPPSFDGGPTAGSVTTSGFTPSASLDEAGTIYYVVVADGATAPSVAEVKAAHASGGGSPLASGNAAASSGNFDGSFSAVTGLSAGTAYDVYFVATDTAGNDQGAVTKVDVTVTPATPAAPVLATASDTGSNTSDGKTSDTTPTYTVSGVTSGATVTLFNDANTNGVVDSGESLASGTASGTSIDLTASTLSDGSYTHIRAIQNAGGTDSAASTAASTLQVDTTAPAWTTSTSQSQGENSTGIVTLTATDSGGSGGVTYSIIGGSDQAKFTISGGNLDFVTAPDFESPTDSDTNNTYVVDIRATDLAGNTADRTITVTVTDVNEAPTDIALANSSILATAATSGATIGALTSTDPDSGGSHSYSLVSGSGDGDNGSFAISGANLVVGGAALADGTYSVRVRSTDNGSNSFEKVFSIVISAADATSTVTASATLAEPSSIATTAAGNGTAVQLLDFTITDTGAGDGLATTVTALTVDVSGTTTNTERGLIKYLLNGNDATNVEGTYNAGSQKITFSGLGISVADGAANAETYTISAYYNDNTGSNDITEGHTLILSVDGDSNFTTGSGSSAMAASQSAVTNGSGAAVDVTATKLVYAQVPSGTITSGVAFTSQPIVQAVDDRGNIDTGFTGTVTLTEDGSGSLGGTASLAASTGVASFSGIKYTSASDADANFTLTAAASGLTSAASGSIDPDVVATRLVFTTEPAATSIRSGSSYAFTTVPVVSAVDADGTVDTGYTTNIVMQTGLAAGNPPGSTVNGLSVTSGDQDADSKTVTLTPSGGVATFTGLALQFTNASGVATMTPLLGVASGSLTGANSTTLTSSAAPAVTAITRTTPSGATTNAASVVYTVTFSEAVSGVDSTDFLLTTTVTGASVTNVSGSGTSWAVTVDTGSGDGTLRLDLSDDDTIIATSDSAALGGTGTSNGDFIAGQSYTLDKTAPAAPGSGAVDLSAGSDTGSSNSDNITSAQAPAFRVSLTGTGAAAGDTLDLLLDGNPFSTPVTVTLSGTDISNAYHDFTLTSGALGSDGVKTLTARVTDALGNVGTGGGTLSLTLDRAAPTATATRSDLVGPTGTSFTFTVDYSDTVAVDSTSLAVANVAVTDPGSNSLTVTAASPSGGAGAYTVTYTVSAPGGSWDTGDSGTYTISLGGTPAKDAAGNAVASLSKTFNVSFDTPPTIDLNGSDPGTGNTVALGAEAVTLATATAAVTDTENDSGNWNNGSLTVSRVTSGGAADATANDLFSFVASGASFTDDNNGNLVDGGSTTFATYANTGGVLTISFNGDATTALVTDVIRHIGYANATPYGDTTIRFALNDRNSTTNADVTVTSGTIYVDTTGSDTDGDAGDGFSLQEAFGRGVAQAGADTIKVKLADGSTITLGGDASVGAGDTLDTGEAKGLTIGPTTGTAVTLKLQGGLTIVNPSDDTLTLGSSVKLANDSSATGFLTKSGAGTLVLGATDGSYYSYTGELAVSAGTLKTDEIGNAVGSVTLSGGATLAANSSGGLTINQNVTLGTDGGVLNAENGNVTLTGTLNGTGALGLTAGSSNGRVVALRGDGSGYAGAVSAAALVVEIGHNDALGTGTLTTAFETGKGKFRTTSSGSFSLGNTTVNITGTGGNGYLVLDAGSLTLSGTVTIGGSDTLNIKAGSGATLTLSGRITGSDSMHGTILGGGTGTVVFSNTGNDYAGTTAIREGTLIIAGASNLGTGALSLGQGGGTVDNAILAVTDDTTLTRNLALVGIGGTLEVASGKTLTLSGTISGTLSGTAGLKKSGSGTLVLSGSNSFAAATGGGNSATVTVDAGMLEVQNGSAIADTVAVALSGSSVFKLADDETVGGITGAGMVDLNGKTLTVDQATDTTYAGDIAGTGNSALIKKGLGTLTLSGTNLYSGSTTVSAGGLTLAGAASLRDSTAVTVDGTLTLLSAKTLGSLSGSGTVALGAAGLTVGGDGSSTDFSGSFTGSGALTKTGTGTLMLSGASTGYSGAITVAAGTLIASGAGALGNATGGTTVSDGATLQVATGLTLAEMLSLSGVGVGGTAGALAVADSASVTLTGTIALTGTARIETGSASTLTLSGAISGTGFGLGKTGAGTLILSGSNTFTGASSVSGGTLSIGADAALGDTASALSLAAGTTLQLTGAATIDNGVTLTGDATLQTDADVLLSGVIGGSGTLAKTGAAKLTLSGANSYSGGTTVAAGTLAVDSETRLGSGPGSITLNGGTLELNAAAFTFANAVSVLAASQITLTATVETVAFNGAFTGSAALAVVGDAGGGTKNLTLGSTGNSAGWSGTLAVTNASVQVASDSRLTTGAITLNAGSALVVTGATVVDNAIAVAGAASIDSLASAVTLSGVISGPGALTLTTRQAGSSLTLSGGNTHVGTVSIATSSGGNIILAGGSALGDGSVATVNAGATLELSADETIGGLAGSSDTAKVVLGADSLTVNQAADSSFAGVISGTGGVTKTGAGTLTLTGDNSFTGATTVSEGGLTLDRAGGTLADTTAVTVAAGAMVTFSQTDTIGALNGAGAAVIASGKTLTAYGDNSSTTLSGALSGGGALVKDGSGKLTLGGGLTADLSGVEIKGGTVSMAATGSLASTALITISSSDNNILEITGDGSFANDVKLATTGTILVAGTVTASGLISQDQTTRALVKDGAGTLALTGSSSYRGATTVQAGTLSIAGAGNIGLGAVTLGSASTVATLVVSGTGVVELANNFTVAGLGGVISYANTGTGDGLVLSGAVGGSGGLTKAGAGTLALTGSGSFTGQSTVAAGTLAVSGGQALTDTGSVTVAAGATLAVQTSETVGALSGAGTVTMASGATLTVTVAAGSATFSGTLSGTGGLAKDGAGTLTLSGANGYTGGTTVSGGTLQASGGAALADAGALSVASGAALELAGSETIGSLSGAGAVTLNANTLTVDQSADGTASGVISGTGALVKQGAAVLTLTGANNYSGGTTVSAGTLNGDTSSLQGIIVNSAAVVFDQTSAGSFAGAISGSGALTKTGGATLTLTGANSYAGTTTITAGTLAVASDGNLGADTVVLNGGTLRLTESGSFDNAILIAADPGTIEVDTGKSITLTGALDDVANSGADLHKTGGGTLILDNTANEAGLTGDIYIDDGDLQVANDDALPAGVIYLADGKELDITGDTQINNPFTLSGDATLNTGSHTVTISGAVTGSAGQDLTKTGSGTLILSGANSYQGATVVTAGKVLVNGSLTGSASVAVGSGATLGGSGTIAGATTIQAGATLAAGNSPGRLSFGNGLTLAAGAILAVEVNGTTAGTLYDQIVVTAGNVMTNGAILSLTLGGGFTPAFAGPDRFTLIDTQGAGTTTGSLTLAGTSTVLGEGTTIYFNGVGFRVSYADGTGNDLVMTTINAAPTTPTGTLAVPLGVATAGTITATDPLGQGISYSLVDNPGGVFAIDATTGVVTVLGSGVVTLAPSTTITIRATNRIGLSATTRFTVAVQPEPTVVPAPPPPVIAPATTDPTSHSTTSTSTASTGNSSTNQNVGNGLPTGAAGDVSGALSDGNRSITTSAITSGGNDTTSGSNNANRVVTTSNMNNSGTGTSVTNSLASVGGSDGTGGTGGGSFGTAPLGSGFGGNDSFSNSGGGGTNTGSGTNTGGGTGSTGAGATAGGQPDGTPEGQAPAEGSPPAANGPAPAAKAPDSPDTAPGPQTRMFGPNRFDPDIIGAERFGAARSGPGAPAFTDQLAAAAGRFDAQSLELERVLAAFALPSGHAGGAAGSGLAA